MPAETSDADIAYLERFLVRLAGCVDAGLAEIPGAETGGGLVALGAPP